MTEIDLAIRVYGWTMNHVSDDGTGGGDGEQWTYTIGLDECYGHPELVMLDVELRTRAATVSLLSETIAGGETLDAVLARYRLELAPVHPSHADDLFGLWEGRYDVPIPEGRILQIIPPPDWFCTCHAARIRRLDRPAPRPRYRR